MSGYEYFEEVLNAKGLKAFDVSKATGIRSGVFSDWKAGRYTPKADKMQEIADFLEVPVEPLLGVNKFEKMKNYYMSISTSIEAQKMLDDYRLRGLNHISKKIDRKRFDEYYNMLVRLYKLDHPEDDYDFDGEKPTE